MFEYLVLNNIKTLVSLLTSDLISTAINDTSCVILSIIKDDYKDYQDLTNIIKELDLIYRFKIIYTFYFNVSDFFSFIFLLVGSVGLIM